jgi:ubiquinone/menaquinone biosynthesis C-methylase UbiE
MKTGAAPYDKQAGSYDRTWRRYITRTLEFLKASISFNSSDQILDLGCGTGELELLVLKERPEQTVVGVDISEKMLELARQKCSGYPNVGFVKVDAAALPFPDQSFDLIVSANSFHYFNQPEKCLAEVRRVIVPTGSVVVLDWCKDYLICRCFDFVLKRFERGYGSCYTQLELARLLDSTGFAVKSMRRLKLGAIFWGHMLVTAAPIRQ